MRSIAMSEAKARLSSLVADPQFEDVVLLRHGKVAAVLINPGRYDELLEAVDDLNDIGGRRALSRAPRANDGGWRVFCSTGGRPGQKSRLRFGPHRDVMRWPGWLRP
jgi:PHD/YefM family antitoxin component YafN of YafNO toxin-antitoxin module